MERKPLTSWQKHCLNTYILDGVDDYFPVNRISQTLKNTGVITCKLPSSLQELINAIDQHGNIAYCMFRRLVRNMVSYELYLLLRNPSEKYHWVWIDSEGMVVKKSIPTFKNEDLCLQHGHIKTPPHVHVAIESEQEDQRGIILV